MGAQSTVLKEVLERISLAYPEGQVQAFPRAIAGSLLVSADMAHAIHPNYADKHDSDHAPAINRGVVIKTNVNQSYATSGSSGAVFERLCSEVGFAAQHFVTRSDMPCGSTIGPITAAPTRHQDGRRRRPDAEHALLSRDGGHARRPPRGEDVPAALSLTAQLGRLRST